MAEEEVETVMAEEEVETAMATDVEVRAAAVHQILPADVQVPVAAVVAEGALLLWIPNKGVR
jgi:hypothetical protein